MKTLILALAAACLAAAAEPSSQGRRSPSPKTTASQPAPAVSQATETVRILPSPRQSVEDLYSQFIESVEPALRRSAMESIARTAPATMRDVKLLFDLFTRFPEVGTRDAILSSVKRLTPADAQLEPAFIEYLKLPESEAKFFGIQGVLRLRALRALPLVTDIAERRFAYHSPGETPVLSDRTEWWAQYEALSAVAQWQGTAALPLLRRKVKEAPAVARLLAIHYWKQSLPDIIKWAGGGRSDRELAHEALRADVPLSALRETRPEMLRILRNPKANRELRHQLALKVGFSSTTEEIEALLGEEQAAQDPETKLTLSAALFSSRSPQTVPWLKRVSEADRDPRTRLGALLQLRTMLPAAEARALLEAAAARDPDADNRRSAEDLLKGPAP